MPITSLHASWNNFVSGVAAIAWIRSAVMIFAVIAVPSRVEASIVTWSFAGTVSTVPTGLLGGPISTGDAMSGVLSYEDSAADEDVRPGAGGYYGTAPNLSASIAVGTYALRGFSGPGNLIVVVDGGQAPFTEDQFGFNVGQGHTVGTGLVNGQSLGQVSLILADSDGAAWSSENLPTAAPDLSQFNVAVLMLYFSGSTENVIGVVVDTLANGVLPGFAPENPILPSAGAGTTANPWQFTGAGSGLWFDPPLTSGFLYEAGPGDLFTSILDFPTGFANRFTVSVDGSVFGTFGPGQIADFSQLPGGGISSFTIDGISPLADAGDPRAFPLRLTFISDTADFTMAPLSSVPEPDSLLLWGSLAAISVVSARRTRRDAAAKFDSSAAT